MLYMLETEGEQITTEPYWGSLFYNVHLQDLVDAEVCLGETDSRGGKWMELAQERVK
jgi:hypothetical protein